MAVVALMQPARAAASEHPVSVSKEKNLFVVKADRKFKGANIVIFSSTGERITSQTMEGRKMVIDFGDVKEGIYTIRISKGSQIKEFQFEKR